MSKYSEQITVTGNPISVNARFGGPCDSLSVPLGPTQDLHGYANPWPAGGGDNKFEPFSGTHNGVTFTVQDDGTVKITGNATAATWTNVNKYVDLPWNGINAGDTVVLWSDIYAAVGSYEGSTLISNKSSQNGVATSYTIPSNATRLRFYEYAKSTVPSAGEVFDVIGHYYFAKANSFSSWTPYSNICPISGRTGLTVYRTGKNLLSYTPTWLNYSALNVVLDKTRATFLKGNTQYMFSFDMENATIWRVAAVVFDENGNRLFDSNTYYLGSSLNPNGSGQYYVWSSNKSDKQTAITPIQDCYVMLFFNLGDVSASTVMTNPMLEIGPTTSSYALYNGNTYAVDWTTPAGTVYGCTVDVVTGVLTVDKACTNISSAWNWQKSGRYPGGFYVSISAIGTGQKTKTPFLCSHAQTANTTREYNSGTCYCDDFVNIRIMDGSDTVQDWKDYIDAQSLAGTPIQICYTLATPITYQLTPAQISLIEGQNCIFTDTNSDITLTYRLLVIDRVTGATSIGKRAESLSISPHLVGYTKVVINLTEELYYESGNDLGETLTLDCPWGTQTMADNILASLEGFQYQPMDVKKAILDPAAEIGDGLTVNGVYGGIFSMVISDGSLYTADVSAPNQEEVEHEYKYVSKTERKVERRLANVFSELSVQAAEIAAKVSETGGNQSFGWELLSTGFKILANGSEVLKVDQNGLTVTGDGTFSGNVYAGNIQYGSSGGTNYGTFSGGGISGGSIGTSKFTSGINTSLGNADYAADIFAGAAIARWLKCNNVEIPAGQSLKIYNAKIKLSTMNVMLGDGTTKYVYYCNWG